MIPPDWGLDKYLWGRLVRLIDLLWLSKYDSRDVVYLDNLCIWDFILIQDRQSCVWLLFNDQVNFELLTLRHLVLERSIIALRDVALQFQIVNLTLVRSAVFKVTLGKFCFELLVLHIRGEVEWCYVVDLRGRSFVLRNIRLINKVFTLYLELLHDVVNSSSVCFGLYLRINIRPFYVSLSFGWLIQRFLGLLWVVLHEWLQAWQMTIVHRMFNSIFRHRREAILTWLRILQDFLYSLSCDVLKCGNPHDT